MSPFLALDSRVLQCLGEVANVDLEVVERRRGERVGVYPVEELVVDVLGRLGGLPHHRLDLAELVGHGVIRVRGLVEVLEHSARGVLLRLAPCLLGLGRGVAVRDVALHPRLVTLRVVRLCAAQLERGLRLQLVRLRVHLLERVHAELLLTRGDELAYLVADVVDGSGLVLVGALEHRARVVRLPRGLLDALKRPLQLGHVARADLALARHLVDDRLVLAEHPDLARRVVLYAADGAEVVVDGLLKPLDVGAHAGSLGAEVGDGLRADGESVARSLGDVADGGHGVVEPLRLLHRLPVLGRVCAYRCHRPDDGEPERPREHARERLCAARRAEETLGERVESGARCDASYLAETTCRELGDGGESLGRALEAEEDSHGGRDCRHGLGDG